MLTSYVRNLLITAGLFGLTLGFAIASLVLALTDLRMGIPVWENDTAYTLITIGCGALFLMVGYRLLRADKEDVQFVTLEELVGPLDR